jgi:transcriptional regulator of acetoin/glycerol metabolism
MENQESQTAGAASSGVMNKMKSEATGVAENAKRQGQEQFEAHKHTAADQTEKLAGVVERVAEEFKGQDQQSLAAYAGQMAGSMKSFAENLRDRSLDDVIRDTQRLARNNPTLFLMGSVAVGIALSRFFKASAHHSAPVRDIDFDSRAPIASETQPVTFESRPSVISGSASPTPASAADTPSFADDLEKGV